MDGILPGLPEIPDTCRNSVNFPESFTNMKMIWEILQQIDEHLGDTGTRKLRNGVPVVEIPKCRYEYWPVRLG